jgi:hypothetical protein
VRSENRNVFSPFIKLLEGTDFGKEKQCFVHNRSATDQIFCIHQIMEKNARFSFDLVYK